MLDKDLKQNRLQPAASPGPGRQAPEKAVQDELPGDGKKTLERLKRERKKLQKEREKLERATQKKSALGTSRGIETMFRTSYLQHVDLSGLADTKSNIMISINGIIISIIIASISPKIDANPWLLVPTSVLLIGCLISMIYAILSARPRVSSRKLTLEDVRQNRANILFFGNFVNLSRSEYVEGMTELLQNTDQLYQNMMQDIYSLGQVLARKFRLLQVSYTVFMFGLVAGVLLFIAVFIGIVAAPTPPPAGTAYGP